MKTSAAALSIALVAGCSSSDSSPPPPVFGGFEPLDQAAVIFAPANCDILGPGAVAMSAVAVYFADYAGVCDVVTEILSQYPYCGTRESSGTVVAFAVSGDVGGSSVGPAGPGTYRVLSSPPGAGPFLAATGDAGKVGAECAAVEGGGNLDVTEGTVVLESVSDTAVTGTVDFRFDDGTGFRHAVDAAVCPLSVDLCARFELPCFDYACVPAAQ